MTAQCHRLFKPPFSSVRLRRNTDENAGTAKNHFTMCFVLSRPEGVHQGRRFGLLCLVWC